METLATLTAGMTGPLLIGLLIAGACIGVLAGLFGVGGGAISVPVFFETFRLMGVDDAIAMPMAVGTSLAIIIPTSIVSARAHARKGTVDMRIFRAWIVPISVGVALGSLIARKADPVVFQAVFVFVASVNAIRLLSGGAGWVVRDTMPTGPLSWAYGFVTGLLSALMGIGGGAISNLIMTMHGKPMREAVSTSAAIGLLIAVPGAMGYMFAGYGNPGLPPDAIGFVSILALLLTIPTALLTTRLGVALAHRIDQSLLRRLFGGFLALVSIRFVVEITGW